MVKYDTETWTRWRDKRIKEAEMRTFRYIHHSGEIIYGINTVSNKLEVNAYTHTNRWNGWRQVAKDSLEY
jgi:hypothetical protein